ncbi:hypothetical protein OsJ_00990 [Oryza sativa Japonica Group]|uniref:Auxin-responsive protein n=1 Tax=Oryza sativa subsp. japonica TaxID=39947 RepID=A2ZQZ4_ORYSJ|nr:hypothetical protein OsJ_00990 [Oryza sativa Japonica Group]
MSPPLELDYIGLSPPPPPPSSSSAAAARADDVDLKGTELRLGLPGSESPDRRPAAIAAAAATATTLEAAARQGAQVVGWPPIRSYRKNTMATNQIKSNKEDVDAKQGQGFLYVKVSMDGAPYLRKVDLKTYKNYKDMSLGLEKMFIGFSTGKEGAENQKDGEYVLTYEDKDGDWMLVGDVPWEMFTDSCRRLRIMKGSDAIGLGCSQLRLVPLFVPKL